MDGLLLRTGLLQGIGTSLTTGGNLEVRPKSQHFSAVGRSQQSTVVAGATSSNSSAAISVSGGEGKPTTNSRFSFRYPFKSLLPWVNNNNGKQGTSSMNGVALDEAILADSTRREGGDGNEEKSEDNNEDEEEEEVSVDFEEDLKGRDANWVFKILRVKSLWSDDGTAMAAEPQQVEENLDLGGGGDRQIEDAAASTSSASTSCGEDVEFCEACQSVNEEDHKEFDRDSFSKLLKKVPLTEAKLYAQLSYLGNLAYNIPYMKERNLLKRQRLRYVTSSIEKREQQMVTSSENKKEEEEELNQEAVKEEEPIANYSAAAAVPSKEHQTQPETQQETDTTTSSTTEENLEQPDQELENDAAADHHGPRISAAAAFHIAASAASFLNTRTRSMLFSSSAADSESSEEGGDQEQQQSSGQDDEKKGERNEESDMDMASLMATTDSVTSVVAAKEEVKQAVADDLNSISSAPCEWYTCDDEETATRFFVIQGSETLASWQANLLFEPTEFEDMGVFVHRGIYEAAKGMYQQMLPEIQTHIQTHGAPKLRFTGHSLGGSLSLLINLMLIIRNEVPPASLLPVITFGSPCVMCGGDTLLFKLGLCKNHIRAVTMHRDIVPRAFSCHYPNHVAEILKAMNASFRNHPCLNTERKCLFSPMGEMVILQPDESLSPGHELLPAGSGMYVLSGGSGGDDEREVVMRWAERSFLNTPHPLEILSDRGAYGNGGTIQRDHDMNSYIKCVRTVIRKELNRVRRVERERRRRVWWATVTPRVVSGGGMLVGGRGPPRSNVGVGMSLNLRGMVRNGSESFKRRFSRLVASQHMHLLVVFLVPAKLLLVGVHSVMGFR